ncbi:MULTISPECIES: phage tail protein [Wolbachia]|uniref:phage tail protein n=1 Tax=Wolbachia TaxID=953 RepID=UPI0003222EE8|nr:MULTISPECIES: phage tail protein [unclassified Wolbachia]UFO00269.1 phage tail protein [Wolbachia endosymbiont of Corcyra cephalonica]CQD10662.1 phage tail protein GpU [Wolbachia endosymbiont wPip_Mol of Culex molestus]
MLSLGQHKLSPTSVRYSKENRWSTIECIGKIPSLQNIGQGAENIDLEGVIYFHNLNDLNQLKSMKETEKNHEPSILVDNLGNVLGRFVIVRLEEKQTSYFPCGLPKKVEFSLSLRSYV